MQASAKNENTEASERTSAALHALMRLLARQAALDAISSSAPSADEYEPGKHGGQTDG